MKLAERILLKRKEMGMTQLEIARKCRVSQSYIAQLEKGKSKPSLDMLCILAAGFGVKPEFFLS